MTGLFAPRLSILPAAQQTLWPSSHAVSDRGFVLYGGTAIALRLGHRVSVDFDFFTKSAFDPIALCGDFAFLAHAETLQSEPATLTVSLPTGDADPVKLRSSAAFPSPK